MSLLMEYEWIEITPEILMERKCMSRGSFFRRLLNHVTLGFGRKILGYSVLYNPVTTV